MSMLTNQLMLVGGSVGTSYSLPLTSQTGLAAIFGTNTVYGIAWNGTVLCAVGASSLCATSPDGITWTARPSFASIGNGTALYIYWDGSVFVASTSNAASIVTSPDGATWTYQTNHSLYSGVGQAIVKTGSTYVQVGGVGLCSTSTTLASWSPTWFTFAFGLATPYAIAFGASLYCVVGAAGACATSPDGVTWTAQPGFTTAFGATHIAYAIKWNGSVFCAVGAAGACATSPDGITWTAQPGMTGIGYALLWSGTLFYRVGALLYTSPDGVTWSKPVNFSLVIGANAAYGVCTFGPNLCIVGSNGTCITSP